ncbi:hypothetical protein CVU37_10470 [candidate division BRC1 bacterium HGW-BRC1-1]|nr:MAG: hypothetical protein CVU37_10470 [candidate division BRC1 bacterium HGW-BRC1-1]
MGQQPKVKAKDKVAAKLLTKIQNPPRFGILFLIFQSETEHICAITSLKRSTHHALERTQAE